ncbi:sensor histidine kinase [Rhodococcus fascians]|nr:sensor histidine kinase [Rhodococcus fascians]MBY4238051.1 sensor histidine kinase [Rhodococcus fascians]MBY4254026.1 sensor histidine kinase [Rhodococcus fascians]MBY4269590.1 sensor histidine kinase [Rhodococcus fascians]
MNILGSLPRSHGRWWYESAIVATAFTLCLLGGMFQLDDTLAPPATAAYVFAAVSCSALPLRHRTPLAALAVTTAVGMLVAPAGLLLSPLTVAPAVITSYSVAVRTDRGAAGTAVVASSTLMVAVTVLFGELSWQDASRLAAVAAAPLIAGVLGYSTQNRRAYLAAVEDRAERAEETRESEARQRVADERVRIARELHDVVAHQLTLANAQATVAAHFFDTRPDQSRKSLTQLVETSRDALDGLRATVGLLRQTGDSVAPTEPAAGLSQLPALVQSLRRIGLEVSVYQDGSVRPLSAGVDLTAYRIVSEALTNVTKHAGTGVARVHLTWSRDSVTITIADDGTRTSRSSSTVPGRMPGYGLIGMRERATAVGGRLSVGPRPEGGFEVSATLPFPSVRDGRVDDGTTEPS